jgi:hypothetical protein
MMPYESREESMSSEQGVGACARQNRGWAHAQGTTHLILDPLDFLRRLAALASFPGSHQLTYHGLFANRNKMRRMLPPPPPADPQDRPFLCDAGDALGRNYFDGFWMWAGSRVPGA